MKEWKCTKINIGDLVKHDGKEKTVICVCLSWVQLSDKTLVEINDLEQQEKNDYVKGCYSNWIDLDDIELIVDAKS